MPDAEVACQTGLTKGAVRQKREGLGNSGCSSKNKTPYWAGSGLLPPEDPERLPVLDGGRELRGTFARFRGYMAFLRAALRHLARGDGQEKARRSQTDCQHVTFQFIDGEDPDFVLALNQG